MQAGPYGPGEAHVRSGREPEQAGFRTAGPAADRQEVSSAHHRVHQQACRHGIFRTRGRLRAAGSDAGGHVLLCPDVPLRIGNALLAERETLAGTGQAGPVPSDCTSDVRGRHDERRGPCRRLLLRCREVCGDGRCQLPVLLSLHQLSPGRRRHAGRVGHFQGCRIPDYARTSEQSDHKPWRYARSLRAMWHIAHVPARTTRWRNRRDAGHVR